MRPSFQTPQVADRRRQTSFFLQPFWLALLLCGLCGAEGGRDSSGSDSLAVDTVAHFHQSASGGLSRKTDHADRQEATHATTQLQRANASAGRDAGHLGSVGESDMIERLGHEIAKQLASQLHEKQTDSWKDSLANIDLDSDDMQTAKRYMSELESHGDNAANANLGQVVTGDSDIASAENLAQQLQQGPGGGQLFNNQGFPETSMRLARRSLAVDEALPPGLLERVANISHDFQGELAREASRERPSIGFHRHLDSSPEELNLPERSEHGFESNLHGGFLDKLGSISHAIDAASILEKSADASHSAALHAVRRSMGLHARGASRKSGDLDVVAGNLLQMKDALVKQQRHQQGFPDFDTLDKDHDGSLSLEEFKELANHNVGDVDVSAIFKQIDKNSSGKIDRQEYEKACKDGVISANTFKHNGVFRQCPRAWLLVLPALFRRLA